ncbi:Dot/Icm secretion system protein IcmQ [Legionella sp. km772]|uniref:Dot/Icm secretion system protein IcmQ n=1 Tax=Legionella sp. km772 TaxID=2498111 RepID=UPI000F8D7D1B|nr:Dot/Icm secretion system protein IcmQ [Legionella sp. km772]RUR12250.1 Dot/Icm secretion system protein IcmQ [Legionella sp. km772]
MNERLTDEQNARILKALNKAIEEGPWDKSNFLRMIGKNLITIRDDFLTRLGAKTEHELRNESQLANKMALRSNQQEIFISLYCFDGTNIQSWERIVANLPKQTVSRPIYANEEDLKEILKLKDNKNNEAYVAIFIDKQDILTLSSDKILKDKLGTPLLSLKDRTLNLENISRFVHSTGTYQFQRGRLVKMPA